MADPDWNDFKIMIALASGGSVAGAARALGVDSSTVSRRLAALEENLGAQLVVRGARFALTAEGNAVLCASEAIQSLVHDVSQKVHSRKTDASAIVRVSCAPGVSAALTRLMPAMRKLRPDLTIELSAENRTVDLLKGEADVAIRMFRPAEPGLVCRPAFDLGWAVYASRDYLAQHGTPAGYDKLGCHTLVRYVSAMHKVPGPRWLEEHCGTAAASVQVDNTEVAAHVVASGGGIGVIPCPVAETRPELVRVFPEPVAANTGFIVYHESARDTARVRATVDVLMEVLTTHKSVFSGRAE